MIVEVRTYRIKPGLRERFLAWFESRSAPVQRSKGMAILGPLVDLEDPDVIVWLRAFPSLEARERIRREFYAGEEWLGELQAVGPPMLDGYTVALTEAPAGFFNDLAATPLDRETPPGEPFAGGAPVAASMPRDQP